jgi:general stress protein 26
MTPVRVTSFAAIAPLLHQRARETIWCSAATIDAQNRPRSRVLHPIWEGAIGWVTTRLNTPKIRHVAANPHVSLAYIGDPFRPVYLECFAAWVDDRAMRERIWALSRDTPAAEGGFDPAETWGAIEDPENGLLRLLPWRVELNDFRARPPQTTFWQADADERARLRAAAVD